MLNVVFTQLFALCSHYGQYTLKSLIPVSVNKTLGTNAYPAMNTHPGATFVLTDASHRRAYIIVPCTFGTIDTGGDLFQAHKVFSSFIMSIDSWV